MKELIEYAKAHGWRIAGCESLTAGLFMASLASVPGASSVLAGGFVTYTNEMKQKLVRVPYRLLYEYGAVSAQCAQSMAYNTRLLTGADYAVSFTGNAGPDVMEGKPAGLVYCCIASADHSYAYTFQYEHMGRNEVREAVVKDMAAALLEIMRKETTGPETGKGNHQG